jgi:Holliday junction resolvasome RuvABC ATP-dependent DNA helicase subunit
MNNAPLRGDYPECWDDFIGQEQAKRKLLVASSSAAIRKAPMDHVLIRSGKAGVGKTALAYLAARQMGTQIKVVAGKIKVGEARMLLSRMTDGDVLFYDEIHQAVQGGKGNGEWLLTLLQDGCMPGPRGLEKAPAITVIGATTDAGRLPETILTRFSTLDLVDYTDDEGLRIVLSLATRVFPKSLPLPSVENAGAIARACCNNPRTIRQLLINVRDIALTSEGANLTGTGIEAHYDLTEAMAWLGLSDDGLTELARRYLLALVKDFGGEATGERTMRDRLNEPGGLTFVERLLMDKGLIVKTRSGRIPTAGGLARAQEIEDAAA